MGDAMKRNRFYVVCIIFALFMLLNVVVTPVFVLVKYNFYGGETQGIVEDVQSRRSRRHRRYQVTYSYAVDDKTYVNISPYGRGARGYVGQEILVRYDPEDPEDAMTSLEKAMAEATLWSGVVVGGTVCVIYLIKGAKHKKR